MGLRGLSGCDRSVEAFNRFTSSGRTSQYRNASTTSVKSHRAATTNKASRWHLSKLLFKASVCRGTSVDAQCRTSSSLPLTRAYVAVLKATCAAWEEPWSSRSDAKLSNDLFGFNAYRIKTGEPPARSLRKHKSAWMAVWSSSYKQASTCRTTAWAVSSSSTCSICSSAARQLCIERRPLPFLRIVEATCASFKNAHNKALSPSSASCTRSRTSKPHLFDKATASVIEERFDTAAQNASNANAASSSSLPDRAAHVARRTSTDSSDRRATQTRRTQWSSSKHNKGASSFSSAAKAAK
mmetsp:Transcript_1543/g.4261  ORF Transcript_1543/g.4261 Transcript_1543/m.4261 type:complete len:297 (-) Transcript_1543:584-1474(-)